MSTGSDRARGARAQAAARAQAEARYKALQGIPYARLPTAALAASQGAFKQLGHLVKHSRGDVAVEVTDATMADLTNRCERAVQYHWMELETLGLIERVRRHGKRTIWIRYTLAGRQSASTRNGTTAVPGPAAGASTRNPPTPVGDTEGAACTRKNVQVHSHQAASAPATPCRFPYNPSLEELDTTSSSRRGDADDDETAAPPGEDPASVALEFVRQHLGEHTYRDLEADRDRLGNIVGGRWECLTAAAAMAALRQRGPERSRLRTPHRWVIMTVRDYAAHGIPAEATRAVEACQEYTAANAQARAELAARARAEPEPEAPPNDDATAQLKAQWAALPESERQRMIAQAKAENPGLSRWPKMLEPLCLQRLQVEETKTAGQISAKTPGQPVARDVGTIPDMDNSTGRDENSPEDSTQTKHNVHS